MSNPYEEVYIVAAGRSPVAKAGKAFATVRPDDLLANVIQQTVRKCAWLDPQLINDVIIGCAMPEGEQGMNVARIASLLAGLPENVPAMTVNRFCSSGLQTVALAADRIALGQADVVLAGGVESMTRVPMGGFHYSANPQYFKGTEHTSISYGMGLTAEIVAEQYNISRQQQDEFALHSHQKAIQAREDKLLKDEIVPYQVQYAQPNLSQGDLKNVQLEITQDEGPRADTSLAALSKLRPVFKANGAVTAGNSSQMSDGAGAVFLASAKYVKEHNIEPLGRFLGFNVAGVAPEVMGIGPIAAVPPLLKKTSIAQKDIGWIELNEAFAAQALAVIQELKFNPEIVNPVGGAIALGHPLGATGAIRLCTALYGLKRLKQKYGLITMCIGTGMGAAGLIEAF